MGRLRLRRLLSYPVCMFGNRLGVLGSHRSVFENLRAFGEDGSGDTDLESLLGDAVEGAVEAGKEYVQEQAPSPAPSQSSGSSGGGDSTSSAESVYYGGSPGSASNAQKVWVVFSLWQAGRLPDGSIDPNSWRTKVPQNSIDAWVAKARLAVQNKLAQLASKGDPFSNANLENTKKTVAQVLHNIEVNVMKVRQGKSPTTVMLAAKPISVAVPGALRSEDAASSKPNYLLYGALGLAAVGAAYYLLAE